MNSRQLRPTVFLDRDGVINENRPTYVKCWQEFVLLPGTLAALRRLAMSEYAIVVVTNQSAIGRGLVSRAEVDQINGQMIEVITAAGGRIEAVYCCPHHPADRCDCRKPRPGLLQQAIAELALDAQRSFMVGDALSDVVAGMAAGCTPILVRTGRGEEYAPQMPSHVRVCSDLGEAVSLILLGDRAQEVSQTV